MLNLKFAIFFAILAPSKLAAVIKSIIVTLALFNNVPCEKMF
jgi:hypothetical protein